MRRAACAVLILLLAAPAQAPVHGAQPDPRPAGDYAALEADLENLRQVLSIPGMSAAVVEDQELAWAAGLGFADVDGQVEASAATPYGLASVTKPIAATLVMQLVEEGSINLDTLVSDYGVAIRNGDGVTVRHLLNHTSDNGPGLIHSYNGNRFGYLGGVIEAATGKSFATELGERILGPLQMGDSALNPLDSWGDRGLRGFESFLRGIGWGEAFDQYPDVYSRLAQPYQFDSDHSIIAGMYHLYHNPAAGMISSVRDLAGFDIALDRGTLLGDAAKTEMFGATVPTLPGQTAQQYGLGWYVQEYNGLRLLWHTGRWPPSTSALYLKVPERELTFIALANTDNLTVPFAGIGEGDVMRSALALAFFRHVVLPADGADPLPLVDWGANAAAITEQIKSVGDPASRAHLERELWAYRQAVASSGDQGRPGVLAAAARQAFPSSELRADPTFTWLPGNPQVIAPILAADSFTTMSRVVLVWLTIVLVALAAMVVVLIRSDRSSIAEWAGWLAASLVTGPVAVAAYAIRNRGSPISQVVCSSLLCITGYAVAWVGTVAILFGTTGDPNPLATIVALVVLPIAVGLLLMRAPRLSSASTMGFWQAARRGVFTETTTAIVGVGTLLAVTIYFDNRIASVVPYPTSPYFGAMLALGAVIGLVAMLPLHYVMLRRGFSIMPQAVGGTTAIRLPRLRDSWLMFIGTAAVTLGVVALFLTQFA